MRAALVLVASLLAVSYALNPEDDCLDKSNWTATVNWINGLTEEQRQRKYEFQTESDLMGSSVNTWTCPSLPPSPSLPTSVHALRPADVGVIAAIGDSLTAANGAGAIEIAEVYLNYRGLSWDIGGSYLGSNKKVEQHFTLPNALKKYNSSIKGWASGIAKQGQNGLTGNARLDYAYPGAKSVNMPLQAVKLVEALQAPTYGFDDTWKIITLFIGGNNLCQYCVHYEANTPQRYTEEIREALDILHDSVPKAFVNLVTMLEIDQIAYLGADDFVCNEAHKCLCYCPLREDPIYVEELQQINQAYKDNLWDLVNTGRYDTREDFTVVIQPFLENTEIPLKSDGTPDMTYWAPDCFHFSKKGHNAAGQALWNNMLEKVNHKSRQWSLNEKLYCPSEEEPYFWTSKNSQ